MTTAEAVKPGGWKKVKNGKTQAGREITETVSRRVFRFTGAALIDRNVPIEPGTRVRIVKLHSCPPPGTMGHFHICDAETAEFLGMVAYGSLEEEQ